MNGLLDRLRRPRPAIDFGQHRIRRRRIRERPAPRPSPVVDFGQHRYTRVQSRRRFLGWGIGVLAAGGFLAYPRIRNKRTGWTPPPSKWEHQPLTSAALSQIPNERLEEEIFEYVGVTIDRDGYDNAMKLFPKLSAGFRAVYATQVLEGEVDNGGFSQFFFNSSAEFTYEARDGFWLIGARQTAQVVVDAIALEMEKGTPYSRFPDSFTYHQDLGERYDYADYTDLEDHFYARPENLSRLRIKYMREHPEQFVGPAVADM